VPQFKQWAKILDGLAQFSSCLEEARLEVLLESREVGEGASLHWWVNNRRGWVLWRVGAYCASSQVSVHWTQVMILIMTLV
jgi:hypothetical protein